VEDAIRCRCGDADRLTGSEAQTYCLTHLIRLNDAVPGGDTSGDLVLLEGEWRCPLTSWRWEANLWGRSGQVELRRRPMTSPEDYASHEIVAERADELSAAGAEIHRFFKVDDRRWHEATIRGWRAREALYPPDWLAIVNALQGGDAAAVEPAVVFLETDPWCFRSGYAKERLLRYLSRMELSDESKRRLRRWLLDALGRGPRREYRLMIRLARTLATAQLEEDLRVLADSSSPAAARSIERVADAVEEARTHPAERLSDRMRS